MVNANVITGQTAEASIDNINDTLLMHDNSASALRKITVASLSTHSWWIIRYCGGHYTTTGWRFRCKWQRYSYLHLMATSHLHQTESCEDDGSNGIICSQVVYQLKTQE